MARRGRLQRIAAWFGCGNGEAAARADGEDWAPGDMAQNDGASIWIELWGAPAPGPAHGDVYRVVEVRLAIDPRSGGYARFLVLSHFGARLYTAHSFRKVTPRADAATAANVAFIEQLKGRTRPSTPAASIVARLKRILS